MAIAAPLQDTEFVHVLPKPAAASARPMEPAGSGTEEEHLSNRFVEGAGRHPAVHISLKSVLLW